jgi:hypothetical protein
MIGKVVKEKNSLQDTKTTKHRNLTLNGPDETNSIEYATENFNSVANRIALISNKNYGGTGRNASKDPVKKAINPTISIYSKTSSNLRTIN